ncbi:hypothetical protein ACFQL0_06020 [Haloplanus litoreus]|uniref:hypothetical protein n=1 Tax=Haloplanus litoreus TaxID=767515 RepID=UPI00361CCC60
MTRPSRSGTSRRSRPTRPVSGRSSSTFEFLVENGATTVTVARSDGDLTITGDGDPPTGDPETYFDYGDAAAHESVGTALPLVRTLAQVHGWEATIDTDYRDGVRLVLTSVAATGVETGAD